MAKKIAVCAVAQIKNDPELSYIYVFRTCCSNVSSQ